VASSADSCGLDEERRSPWWVLVTLLVTRASPTAAERPDDSCLRHEAYFYDNAGCYLADLLGFVRGGLARNEPVLIAVPSPNLEQLSAGRRCCVGEEEADSSP
jgi:hypothetical protein